MRIRRTFGNMKKQEWQDIGIRNVHKNAYHRKLSYLSGGKVTLVPCRNLVPSVYG